MNYMNDIIDFGKYKGYMIKDIPTEYLSWFVKRNNIPISLSSIKTKFINELSRRNN